MSDRTTRKPSGKDRLRERVSSVVSVLDQEKADVESDLIQTIENPSVRAALQRNRQYGDLPLELIEPDPVQVRRVDTRGEAFRELVDSVREHGVIEPITVRWLPERKTFQIITGERRFRAASQLHLKTIPTIVRDLSDTDKAIHQLVENIQRENMNPVDEAKAFQRYLAATGEERQELARKIGKSKAYVSQVMSLLEKLTVEEQEDLASISPAKLPGKSLMLEALRVDDVETRRAILRGELTRQEARQRVEEKRRPAQPGRKRFAMQTFKIEDPEATVTVRLKQAESSPDLIAKALASAFNQLTEKTQRKSETKKTKS
jgi:ParB family chromosome partitioning protein